MGARLQRLSSLHRPEDDKTCTKIKASSRRLQRTRSTKGAKKRPRLRPAASSDSVHISCDHTQSLALASTCGLL